MVRAVCLSNAIRKCQSDLLHNQRHLTRTSTKHYSSDANKSDEKAVSIGSVSKRLSVPQNPEFVPRNYLPDTVPKETLQDLKWMLQKDLLGQDIFLLGRPGSGRRTLAQQYLELTRHQWWFFHKILIFLRFNSNQERSLIFCENTHFWVEMWS